MSSDSAVTYTSVHSKARSWSIPSEDPYEEAARQLLEQAPHPSKYVPDPIELEDHVPVYIPEPKHPKDLVPAEDEALIEPYITEPWLRGELHHLPYIIRYFQQGRHHCYLYHYLPHPLAVELTFPRLTCHLGRGYYLLLPPRVEIGETSAAAARQPGSTMAYRVDHSFVDTVDTRVRDTERKSMAAVEVVNLRVSYQVAVHRRESLGFYSPHQEAQEDRAAVRAEIEILRRERLAYEQESIENRLALASNVFLDVNKHEVQWIHRWFRFGYHALKMLSHYILYICDGLEILAARQLLEQAPCPSELVPDPMELVDHVQVYIPELEHPKDLVPGEDEAPIEPYIIESSHDLEESNSTIYISFITSNRDATIIPLHTPSTSRRADIPEADTPPQKRLLLTAPIPRVEVGESSATAASRQPGSTMARRVDHSFIDTVDTSEVQEDRAAVRAEIEILRRERLAYEQESIETRQALARSEAYSRALVAQIRVLETQAYRHERQRQDADDHAIEHIIPTQALEAGARVDTLEYTGSSA
ncbi:hypothetical protein Tco_1457503 [Tanacetum coccineum]